ncbi:hypothetical protein COT95_00235 [Candidatus Falkowbacteria bacterium CG10_big_fil_rev_8_21_14_0_10_37_6]|uniref:NYN domain-containing protein n=1 Tax=Candidatus Falkowbacteria bacterium CG10_big_fil_rev_8_21_14_0_10_37_6 TaxID=1974563 RepID=A0A2H0V7V5_9BACT|nr:MAG: hypothetical protein COT95_00235 [Candidatus Falkowbacteria bacterium CG10_big_fil_rev_8_21_14_0_10_37_6]
MQQKVGVIMDLENVFGGKKNYIRDRKALPNCPYITINYHELILQLSKLGSVVIKTAFIPDYHLDKEATQAEMQALNLYGFFCFVAPTSTNKNIKDYQKVDRHIIEFSEFLIKSSDIDTLVVIADDGDFIPIINKCLDNNKKIIFIETYNINTKIRQHHGVRIFQMPFIETYKKIA